MFRPLLLLFAVTVLASSLPLPFDVNRSHIYLTFAYAAFCPSASLFSWTCEWCTTPGVTTVAVIKDDETGVFGFVAFSKKNSEIVVSFRGSVNPQNWIVDFDIKKVRYNGTTSDVHAGFYYAWSRIQDRVVEQVVNASAMCGSSCSRVVCTGHSLGAALSGFAALSLRTSASVTATGLAVSLHNFGMPRIGDDNFAALFDKTITESYRMVHNHDIVPHLPLRDWGFHHSSREVWDRINSTSGEDYYVVCDDSGEDPSCCDSVPTTEWSPSDHLIYMGVHNDNCAKDFLMT